MEHRIPTEDFYAFKLGKRDKEKLHPNWGEECIKNTKILYPKTDDFYDDKVFVSGIGWKKFSKTNKILVPLFSGNIEDWDAYLNEYGKECLYYSLTGYSLDDGDCCASNSRDEFYSILQCNGGITKYQSFVEKIKRIQEIQTQIINDKLSYLSEWERKYFIEQNIVRPCFRILMFIISPYLDTIEDDIRMRRFYCKYRKHEIETSHPEYNRMTELTELMKEEGQKGIYVHTQKYVEYQKERDEIRGRIKELVDSTLSEEIDKYDNGVFPVCSKERMRILFGDECVELYDYILTNFK